MGKPKWKKIPAWSGPVHQGCLNCPPVEQVAPMTMLIAVGFGDAHVSKDGKIVFRETSQIRSADLPTLAQIEKKAARDSNHDWRIVLNAPLRSREYQRHGEGQWVLIESGQGFA